MARVSERELAAQLEDALRLLRLRWYHTHDSRRSPAGFPDYVITTAGLVMFVELKAEGGRVTAEQLEWLEALSGPYRPALVLGGLEGTRVFVDWLVTIEASRKAGRIPPPDLPGCDGVVLIGADVKPPAGFSLFAAGRASGALVAGPSPLPQRTERPPRVS